jgi:hypothetical protein
MILLSAHLYYPRVKTGRRPVFTRTTDLKHKVVFEWVYMKKLLALIDILVVDKNMFGPYWAGHVEDT